MNVKRCQWPLRQTQEAETAKGDSEVSDESKEDSEAEDEDRKACPDPQMLCQEATSSGERAQLRVTLPSDSPDGSRGGAESDLEDQDPCLDHQASCHHDEATSSAGKARLQEHHLGE